MFTNLQFKYSASMNRFTDYYYRKYSVKSFSCDHLFCIFVYYLIIALPFYFVFGGKNFWLEETITPMITTFNANGLYALQIYTESGIETGCNIPNAAATLTTLKNFDVKITDSTNSSSVLITLNNYASKNINSVSFILYYDVKIPLLNRNLSSAVSYSLVGNVQYATVDSFVQLSPAQPVSALRSIEQVNTQLYYPYLAPPISFADLSTQIYQNKYPITAQNQKNIATGSTATRKIKINIEKNAIKPIPYYPSLLEKLKFNFLSYFAFFIISYLGLRWFLTILSKEQALNVFIQDELPKKYN